ncbi:MAG: NAD(P)H-dependent oxidoreductase [Burkholderiales bacterium]|nr:NAD(P)H-dependent oxidoreductase [Burkholderiales bacterium]
MPAPSILLLVAHPGLHYSRVNRALMDAATTLTAQSHAPQITVRDLYACYPDQMLDVQTEQTLAEQADLIVWQHPIHWFSMPPLMKQWLDEVLTQGWAYGEGGTALQGKDLWLVASTGGYEGADTFLPPYEQTAAVCGMRFLPPLILHGLNALSDADLQTHITVYQHRLASYPNWPEN